MTIRLAALGVAHPHVHSYIACAQALAEVELLGVGDDDPARAQACADRHGLTARPIEALLAERPDGVILCAENVHHRRLTEAAAAAGAGVLCEKPLATTAEDGRAMIAACARAGVALMTAFPCRFATPIAQARAHVAAGGLGRVLAMVGTNRGTMPGGWFTDPALSGGGAVMDHTVHVVDLMRWFTGAEVATVHAEIGTLFHPSLPVEDTGVLSLTFTDGTFATLDTSWARLPDGAHPTWGDVTLSVAGTGGSLEVDAFGQRLHLVSEEEGKLIWAPWGDDMDAGLIAEFVAALAERRPPAIAGEDGLRAVEVALAAYRSAAEGRTVSVGTLTR